MVNFTHPLSIKHSQRVGTPLYRLKYINIELNRRRYANMPMAWWKLEESSKSNVPTFATPLDTSHMPMPMDASILKSGTSI